MTTADYTAREAYEALKKVIKAAPLGKSTVYEKPGTDNCVYWHGDGPSCVVGAALFELGVDPEEIERLDTACEGIPASAINLAEYGLGSNDANQVLYRAQTVQDGGETWGEALKAAKYKLAELE